MRPYRAASLGDGPAFRALGTAVSGVLGRGGGRKTSCFSGLVSLVSALQSNRRFGEGASLLVFSGGFLRFEGFALRVCEISEKSG